MRKQPPTGRQKRAREPRRPLPRRDREPTNGYEKKSNGKTSRHWAAPPHTSTDDQCHTEGDWTGSPRRISKSHRAAKPSATAADRLAVAARTDAAVRGGMDVRGRLDGRLAGRAGVVRERGREGDETGEPGGEPRGGDAGGEEVRVMVRWRGGRAGGVKCCTGPSTAAGAE